MSKLRVLAASAALAAAATLPVLVGAASATPLGPEAAACEANARRPALLVRVIGLKARTGMIRVQEYGGDPSRYFEKGAWLKRIDVPVPATGPIEVCLPAARPGTYAVSVRHDLDGSGKTSLSDGGGMSGNPQLSLFDVMFRRKPDPEKVAVRVGEGVVPVPVVLNYVQGASFKPVGASG